MATILDQYLEKQNSIRSQIAENSLPPEDLLIMQELNYRICVLETFQAFSKSAPMGMKVDDLSYHYQLVDTYIKSVLNERQFGAKTDADGKKLRETAHQSLEKVVQAGRKQFSGVEALADEVFAVFYVFSGCFLEG